MGLVIQQEGEVVLGGPESSGASGSPGGTSATATGGRSRTLVTQLSFDERDLQVCVCVCVCVCVLEYSPPCSVYVHMLVHVCVVCVCVHMCVLDYMYLGAINSTFANLSFHIAHTYVYVEDRFKTFIPF